MERLGIDLEKTATVFSPSARATADDAAGDLARLAIRTFFHRRRLGEPHQFR
jgi:hypothetical protein